MIVFQPIDTPQELTVFIRKEFTTVDVVVTEEQTDVDTTYTVSGTYDNGKLTVSISHDFVEGRFYMLTFYGNGTSMIINRTKVFVTEQTDLEKYSMVDRFYKTIDKDERTYKVRE